MPEKKMEEAEQEARRLKSLAEAKCKASNFKSALKYAKRAERLSPDLDGISSMVTAFKILRTASKNNPNPNWYKILHVEPFSHTNTIKKNYKKLAFLLHPDKNPHAGSEEAFKLVNEAFRFLSDQVRRKEYDMRLRIKIQDEKIKENSGGVGIGVLERDTFWTACSTCRLLHQFERRYLGQNLVCPSCRKSFKALEAESGENGENCENAKVRASERLRRRRDVGSGSEKGKMEMGSEGLGGGGGSSRRVEMNGVGEARLRRRMSSVGEVMERCKAPEEAKTGEELMTLAEMQAELKKKKALEEKKKMRMKLKVKGNKKKDERGKRDDKRERLRRNELSNGKSLKVVRRAVSKKIKDLGSDKNWDLENMAVEDSDFYNFDKDRGERSFKKGQVWAIYDDDDGMPRHYGLIDEVVSVNPFEVKISWLDVENNGDEWVASQEKMGFHVTCGRFQVARKTFVNSVNIFSHVVDCERAAREIYRIYPKKGSVWALYNEAALDAEGGNLSVNDNRCYDIVVFLTTYSEMYGLSMGYLEKVDGFKTVFKRREIGSHAIRRLQKNDVRLVSHQIPARKLSGDEAPSLLKECWELDPASLPPELLTFGWGR